MVYIFKFIGNEIRPPQKIEEQAAEHSHIKGFAVKGGCELSAADVSTVFTVP